jgi:hypothetical protein
MAIPAAETGARRRGVNLYVNGVLWVLGAALVGAIAAYLVRKFGHTEGKANNNESVGQVFTIVGGVQAVLIAFVLISLFDGVSAADEGAYREANNVVAIAWAAEALPEPARTTVITLSNNYLDTVANAEWPRMRNKTGVGGTGLAQLDRLRATLNAVQTTDDWQLDRKTEATNRLWDVYQARQDRLKASFSAALAPRCTSSSWPPSRAPWHYCCSPPSNCRIPTAAAPTSTPPHSLQP